MTYRERRLRKAERLSEWAVKRDLKADGLLARNEPYRGDIAFNTQPGHIPERARVIARSDRAFEHQTKAADMRGRAASILDQADRAIYHDDPDAIPQLQARIDELTAKRDRMKMLNAAIRRQEKITGKANRDLDAADLQAAGCTATDVAAFWPELYGWRYPAYAFSNLSGNIKRQRDRLDRQLALERVRAALASES